MAILRHTAKVYWSELDVTNYYSPAPILCNIYSNLPSLEIAIADLDGRKIKAAQHAQSLGVNDHGQNNDDVQQPFSAPPFPVK